ncbi:MAG: polysaccharide biosynthesis protein [Clostridia bacterium]
MIYDDKIVLITGGTGTVGKAMTNFILQNSKVKQLVLISRNEYNQVIFKRELVESFGSDVLLKIRFVLCDICDYQMLKNAFINVNIVIHTAALKHIDLCEKNIENAIKINVDGTKNIISLCVDNNVEKAIIMSTDKACAPSSVYGASKLISERIFLDANKQGVTKFSVLRCGNIAGSSGSVIPLFKYLIKNGATTLPITDKNMSRFWLSIYDVTYYLNLILQSMEGGEVVIPKMPSFKLVDLVEALLGKPIYEIINLRKGEKIDEKIFNENCNIYENNKYYIECNSQFVPSKDFLKKYKRVFDLKYSTNQNSVWLSMEEIKNLIKDIN